MTQPWKFRLTLFQSLSPLKTLWVISLSIHEQLSLPYQAKLRRSRLKGSCTFASSTIAFAFIGPRQKRLRSLILGWCAAEVPNKKRQQLEKGHSPYLEEVIGYQVTFKFPPIVKKRWNPPARHTSLSASTGRIWLSTLGPIHHVIEIPLKMAAERNQHYHQKCYSHRRVDT